HFDDIAKLLAAFRKLLQAGHSLLVIEHNLDVIKTADWIIDLGPEGGEEGGQLIAAGTPEQIVKVEASHTGRYLRDVLAVGRANAYGTGRALRPVLDCVVRCPTMKGLPRIPHDPNNQLLAPG